MRIAIYTHEFAPSVGGIETFVMGLARGLAAAGRDVTVITARAPGPFDDGALPFRVLRRPSFRALVAAIREADVVHLAGPVFRPMVTALLLRKPLVIEHHGWQSACPNGQMYLEADDAPCPGWFMKRRYGECLRCNASRGVVESARMLLATFPRRWISQLASSNVMPSRTLAAGLVLRNATVVHHGVERSLETVEAGPIAIAGPPVIAYVGRLVTTKGIGVLLAAARELSARNVPFALDVYGEGPERAALEERARAWGLGDRVRFRGGLAPEERTKALAAAPILAMPTLAEIFGLVAAEAMMMGKAVVATDLPVMREVVGDAGVLAPPRDAVALADALQHLLESPALAAQYGARGRKRALEMFRERRMLAEHAALYDRVVGAAHADEAPRAERVRPGARVST